MAKNKDWHKLIAIDPKIQGGKPVIKGTRVPVQVLIGELGGGMTVAETCRQYRVSRGAVLAAMSYAAEVARPSSRGETGSAAAGAPAPAGR
jgi:uncharacterized protein (DUF433 family)